MTTLYDNNAISIAIDNLSNQLIAFQQTILAREEGQRFPTLDDLALQAKIIVCLDKLRRFLPKAGGQKAVIDFIQYIKNGNEQIGESLYSEYHDYLFLLNEKRSQKNGISPIQADAEPVAEPVTEPAKTKDIAPFTEEDFHEYKYLIGEFRNSLDNAKVSFKGRHVNVRWFEYNMFQYTLPVANRRFIDDTDRILRQVDKKDLHESIRKYQYNLVNVAA